MKIMQKWLLVAIYLCGGVVTGTKAAEPLAEGCSQRDTVEYGSLPPAAEVTDAEGNRYRLVPLRSKDVVDAAGNRYRLLQSDGEEVIGEDGNRYRLAPLRKAVGPRQSLCFEIGALVNGINRTTGCEDINNWQMPGEYPGERRYYRGPLRTTGAIGIAYGYRIRRWLEVGAAATYTGVWRDIHFSADDRISARQREHFLSVMPYVRFSWINRPAVRLYAGLHLGYQWSRERDFFSQTQGHGYFAGHLTLIGVSFGRKLFGYAEFGIGMRGVALAGIGYRFGKTLNR